MILRFVFGILLGIFFYGGLWLTVRRLHITAWPFALSLGSLLLRMGLTVGGFLLIVRGSWKNAVAALLGLTAVRIAMSFWPRPAARSKPCT